MCISKIFIPDNIVRFVKPIENLDSCMLLVMPSNGNPRNGGHINNECIHTCEISWNEVAFKYHARITS